MTLDLSDDGAPSIGGLVDDFPHAVPPFTDDKPRVLQHTVTLSVDQALRSTRGQSGNSPVAQQSSTFQRPAGTATPLGLHRHFDKSLEEKILRVPPTAKPTAQSLTPPVVQSDPPAQFVSTSTNPAFVPGALVSFPTSALNATPYHTLPSSAPLVSPNLATLGPRSPANVTRSRVLQRSHQRQPTVSTPIDVKELNRELCNHPDRNFVTSLISALSHGAHIAYNGLQSPRFSRNLISASQHPEVVSANLEKEIHLGKVAGPFTFPPLPNLQCHPVGVVPKKDSTEWHTIYHLSYPEGDSITDHIP